MKKTLFVLACGLVGFLGGLGALEVGKVTDRQASSGDSVFASGPAARPVSFEPGTAPALPDFRTAAKRVTPSIVSVDTMSERQTWMGDTVVVPSGSGSGVIISKSGYIMTNNHVVQQTTAVKVHLADGRAMDAKVIGTDPRSDLAVLKVEADNLVPIELGSSTALQVGDWVMAVGNPLGYDNTVSVGVVSSLGRSLPTEGQGALVDAIQTDAAINPGNSGGALCNADGQLVGINTAIATPSGGSVGIGFAIPVDRAKKIVDDIVKFGRAKRGILGIETDPRSGLLKIARARQELAQLTGAEPPSDGILIRNVGSESPASKAGMHQYDVLLSIDGKKTTEPIDFIKAMIDKKPGDKVSLKFWSKGEVRTAQATLVDLVQS